MEVTQQEHSLRNKNVGEAYMIMLDVYQNQLKENAPLHLITEAIDQANPWGAGENWQHQAWKIALAEFYKDYNLTPCS